MIFSDARVIMLYRRSTPSRRIVFNRIILLENETEEKRF